MSVQVYIFQELEAKSPFVTQGMLSQGVLPSKKNVIECVIYLKQQRTTCLVD